MNDFYNNLLAISGKYTTWIDLIPIIAGLWYFKKIDRALKWFLFYRLSILVINVFEQLLIWGCRNYPAFKNFVNNDCGISNTFFINIFVRIAIYIFLGYFFSIVLSKSTGRWIQLLSICLCFIALFICIFIDGFYQFGTINAMLCSIFIIGCATIYLQKSIYVSFNISLFKVPYFIICLCLFFGVLFSILFSLFNESLQKENFIMFVKLSILSNILHIIITLLYVLAFYYASKTNKQYIL